MASTRSKNDPGNYALEQRYFDLARKHIHGPYGMSYKTTLSELGPTPSHFPRDVLSHNPVEIESKLFGIGSSDLVNHPRTVYPQLKSIPTQSWFDKIPMIKPLPLVTEPGQRPSLWS